MRGAARLVGSLLVGTEGDGRAKVQNLDHARFNIVHHVLGLEVVVGDAASGKMEDALGDLRRDVESLLQRDTSGMLGLDEALELVSVQTLHDDVTHVAVPVGSHEPDQVGVGSGSNVEERIQLSDVSRRSPLVRKGGDLDGDLLAAPNLLAKRD